MRRFRKKDSTPVSAYVGGAWRKCGVLYRENGRPVFEQKIRPEQILRIRGAAGVDIRYEPELPPDTVIRHIVDGVAYEIPLAVLKNHSKTNVQRIGPFHPVRMYLPYRYWKNVAQEQLSVFDETETPGLAGAARRR